MFKSQNIISPRPQRHPQDFAAIINWKETVPAKGHASGAVQGEGYVYMGHGGLYEQRVRAHCIAMVKYIADMQYVKAVLDVSHANQAPPWLPAPMVVQHTFTTDGQPIQKATLVGHDGAHWPRPPPESRSSRALAASHKPVPNTKKPLPSIPWDELRAPHTAAQTDSPSIPDSEVSTSGSKYSQESIEETITPHLEDLSLAELGRQWYATFGKEVGAGLLPSSPPPVPSPPSVNSRPLPPLPPHGSSPSSSRMSVPHPSLLLSPLPPRVSARQ
ncbi:hypothetical protein TRAPUB_11825 [Trametes pubescens]|uniref:Uncharacterized protein n=1 Tax=Trametes pubescens TaxID=154538 RepID=A0A1M2VVT8_TRAPU|nr:hypothetical protein TRAPUB_11825 [Trametes pubescens]